MVFLYFLEMFVGDCIHLNYWLLIPSACRLVQHNTTVMHTDEVTAAHDIPTVLLEYIAKSLITSVAH